MWIRPRGHILSGGTLKPWDPDSDDDLTDGQERHGVTRFVPHDLDLQDAGHDASSGIVLQGKDDCLTTDSSVFDDESGHEALDRTDPDSDDDGWWDGWIGVYGVGYNSTHVIRYVDNLRVPNDMDGLKPEFGLKSHQIVQE